MYWSLYCFCLFSRCTATCRKDIIRRVERGEVPEYEVLMDLVRGQPRALATTTRDEHEIAEIIVTPQELLDSVELSTD